VDEARHRAAEAQLWASVGVTPTERRLDLARTGTTVRVQEVGDGPPVVFVHGASNTGSSWAPLVARLPDMRCVLLDRPGCGFSEPIADRLSDVARLEAFADALVVDVLDAMGIDTAMVVGTSFGGFIALRTAAAHPDRVTRTVEIGWTIGAPISTTPMSMRIAKVPGLGRLMLAVPPSTGMIKAMLKGVGLRHAIESGRFGPVEIEWFKSVLRDTDTMRNELRSLPPILTPIKGINESILFTDELLRSIRTPVRFLWGGDDPMGGEATARAFVDHIPDAELEMMANAGHAPWMDDPDLVAATTRRFLYGPAS
jgi:2-hydroxy-6-oxonona-2,4-dienedioate hydrolase